jgi:hypothetical protein
VRKHLQRFNTKSEYCYTYFYIYWTWCWKIRYNTSILEEPSWWWSYASWMYNYLCNQYISPTTLCVWIQFRRGVLDTTKFVSSLRQVGFICIIGIVLRVIVTGIHTFMCMHYSMCILVIIVMSFKEVSFINNIPVISWWSALFV